MPEKNKGAGRSRGAPQKQNICQADSSDGSVGAQRVRLLEALSRSAVTTLDARSQLDVLHPAARVKELREAGHDIRTVRVIQQSVNGALHSVAKYIMVPRRRRAKRGAA